VALLLEHPDHARHAAQDAALLTRLAEEDSTGLLRLYLASALPRIEQPYRLPLARALASHAGDAGDRQQPLMIWYGIESSVATNPREALAIAAQTPMLQLSRFIARRLTHDLETRPEGVEQLVQLAARLGESERARQRELLEGMAAALSGWRRATPPAGWPAAQAALAASSHADVVRLTRELSVVFGDGRAVDELRAIVKDGQAAVETRRSALRSLIDARAEGLESVLRDLLPNRDFTTECIRGLAVCGGPGAPQLIASRYPSYRLESKEVAISTLVSRPDFAPVLLAAVAEGKIPRDDVAPFQLRQMLTSVDAELAERVRTLWPELQQLAQSKQQRIRDLTAQLTAASISAGRPEHGRVLFAAACAKCHKLFGDGGTTAPELTGAQRTNLAYLLENIVDPSATISKNYQMSVVLLDDGRVLNGVVTTTTDRTITLQTPTEAVVLDRESIEELRETNLSLMPEGQLDRLSREEIRDLIAYLMSPSQVALPASATAGGAQQ
jgi:putative heme-binding domain-containing protein